MLKKENRLKKSKDFQKVFKNGLSASSGPFRIKVLDKTKSLPTRFGFIVSNKTDKRASKRNIIKRLMRAETLSLISDLKSGYDVVVSFQGKFAFPLQKETLRQNIKDLYQKARLIK